MSPVRVAGHIIKNRIISGPICFHTASNGEPHPTESGIRFFEARAKAGAGLVTCAGVAVGGAIDDGVHCSWDVTKPNNRNRLCDMVERIHFYGAKCSMELIGFLPDDWTVSDGCSIMGWRMGRGEVPRSVLDRVKQGYFDTAAELKRIGFDGILLHFGHSNPIAQFLSPLTNKRTDEYGGSTENRCRYPKEIIDGVRAAVGKDMIIELRYSATEYEAGGVDLDEGIRIGGILQENIDILQASSGMHNSRWKTTSSPCGFLPPIPNVYVAETLKKSGKINVPITTLGGFGSIADADAVIAAGKADFVLIARALIADIDLLKKGLVERQHDVTPCIKCLRCHDSDNYEQHMQCSVNPRVGMEQFLERLETPPHSKSVAVIGGGPAGMTAALTAAERGHRVTLFEKETKLGGRLRFADYVSFKYPLANYTDYLISQVERSLVEIRLDAEAKPEDLADFDAVIAAVGSQPVVPEIPGVENAIKAVDVYGNESALGQKIAVVGGGQVGVETALHLARLGHMVKIVESLDSLAPDASISHRDELLVEMQKSADNLEVLLGARCTGIAHDGVTYERDGESVTIPTDSVVLAAGMRALTDVADSFIGITSQYAPVGDCVKARSVEWAVKEAFYAAMSL